MEFSRVDKIKIEALKARLRMFGQGKPIINLAMLGKFDDSDRVNHNNIIKYVEFPFAFYLIYDPRSLQFDTTANPSQASEIYDSYNSLVYDLNIPGIPAYSIVDEVPVNVVYNDHHYLNFSLTNVLKIAYATRMSNNDVVEAYYNWIVKLYAKPKFNSFRITGIYNYFNTRSASVINITSLDSEEYRLLETDEDYLWLANLIMTSVDMHTWDEQQNKAYEHCLVLKQTGIPKLQVNYKNGIYTSYQAYKKCFWDCDDTPEQILIDNDLLNDGHWHT